jgi:hypothetical protein
MAGISIATTAYVRPIGIYLIPLVAAMAFSGALNWREALKNFGVIAATAIVCIAPWMVRNYHLSGHFAFSSVSTFNVYNYNVPLFEQARTGVPYMQVRAALDKSIGTDNEEVLDSFTYEKEESSLIRQYIGAHPLQYALFHLIKSAEFFISSSIVIVTYHLHVAGVLEGEHAQGEGAFGMLMQHHYREAAAQIFSHIPRLLERVLWVLAYLGVLYTTFVFVYRRKPGALFVLAAFLLIHEVAILTGPVSDDPRYRMPAEPFILLLASAALMTGIERLRSTKWLYSVVAFRQRPTP